MSPRGTAEEKTANFNPIYRNQLVNMLVNRTLKHGKNYWLIKLSIELWKRFNKRQTNPLFLLSKQSWSNSRYSNKSETCKRIDSSSSYWNRICTKKSAWYSLVIRGILKMSGSKYNFQISSELVNTVKESGDAIHKKEETHKMSEANRVFAHFRQSMNKIYIDT